MKNEFTGLTLVCTPSQLVIGPTGAKICPITNGQQVLSKFGILPGETIYIDIIALIGILIIARFLGYVFLKLSSLKY